MDIEEYELICNARLNVFRFNEIESQTNLNVGYEGGGGGWGGDRRTPEHRYT